ncbi:hypothetical protein FGRMN_7253 [Fusarium graminum]|nr:hypothetical protein FGRMN_7253 [Fusarium graminum]
MDLIPYDIAEAISEMPLLRRLELGIRIQPTDIQVGKLAKYMALLNTQLPQLNSLKVRAPFSVLKTILTHCDKGAIKALDIGAWFDSAEFNEAKLITGLERLQLYHKPDDLSRWPCGKPQLWKTLREAQFSQLKSLVLYVEQDCEAEHRPAEFERSHPAWGVIKKGVLTLPHLERLAISYPSWCHHLRSQPDARSTLRNYSRRLIGYSNLKEFWMLSCCFACGSRISGTGRVTHARVQLDAKSLYESSFPLGDESLFARLGGLVGGDN